MDIVTTLQQVDLFRELNDTQLRTIGNIAQQEIFNMGEVIFKQGDVAEKIYIISNGQVEVIIEHADGVRGSVLFLGAGN